MIRTILFTLATRRLTSLVVDDEITRPLRERLWKERPPETSKLGYLVNCRICSSIWAAAIVLILSRFVEKRGGSLAQLILDTLALSECVIVVDALLPKNDMFD